MENKNTLKQVEGYVTENAKQFAPLVAGKPGWLCCRTSQFRKIQYRFEMKLL